jgi:hypothetical protein
LNILDLQPDEYYFNFGNYSGKFVFAPDGNIRLMPASSIKVVRDYYARKPRFVVTTDDGIVYTFAGTEETDPGDNGSYGTPIMQYVSTWYLTSIAFPDSKQTITFEYSTFTTTVVKDNFYTERWEITSPLGGGLVSSTRNFSTIKVYGLHLSKINYPNGSIQFIPKAEARVDLPGDQMLEYIRVYDKANTLLKSYKMDYTYYNNTLSDANCKRLRLEKVQEIGTSGGTIPPYLFTYNNIQMPCINAFDQDHYGYYNQAGNSKLIPPGKIGSTIIPGGNRAINPDYSKVGILEKITYPAGGTTTFEFESNTQYADEKELVRANAGTSCNSGYQTPNPWGCTSESAPFTLANAVGDIEVYTDRQYVDGNNAQAFLVDAATGNVVKPFIFGGGTYYLTGVDRSMTFKIRVVTEHEGGDFAEFCLVGLTWYEYSSTVIKSKPAPGLRIRKITSADGIDATATKVISYSYDMFNDAGRSSGYVTSAPLSYEYNFDVISAGMEGTAPQKFLMRSSKSQSDIGGSECVFYRNVKKINGTEAQNGSVNSYYDLNDNPNCSGGFFPYAPCANLDYKNQLLTRQVTFNNAGKIIKDDSYTYFFDQTNNYSKVPGVAAGYSQRNYNDHGSTTMDFNTNIFTWTKYDYISEWFYLKTLKSITNDQNGLNPVTNTTTYTYNNPAHMQLSSVGYVNSLGEGIGTSKRYPLDYILTGTLTGSAFAMQEMVNRHIVNWPVEEMAWKLITVPSFSQPITGGSVHTFKLNNGQVVKDANYNLKISSSATGIPMSEPAGSGTAYSSISNGQFTFDARFEKTEAYDTYDASNNLLQLTDRKGTYSMIREPNTGQVWAKSKNGTYADIAYSSFENTTANAFTNLTYNLAGIIADGQSGVKAFNLTNNPVKNLIALKTAVRYKVSYWVKVSTATVTVKVGGGTVVTIRKGAIRNGWQYCEGFFTNATDLEISGNAIIDEVRFYPAYDRMTSYVFKQGVGIISECDENNQNIFWEYDEFNRLKLVRDQDKNILNKTEYNYQQVQ